MGSAISALKRSLLLRLAAFLLILAALLFYSYYAMVGIIRAGRQEVEIVNATGRQRMLVQQFVRQANLALIGLSISDWNILLEQRKLSEKTSDQFDQTMNALLNGGKTDLGGGEVVIARVGAQEVRARLEEIAGIWEEVKRASVLVLRSTNKQLRDHPDLALMQTAASRLVKAVDETLFLMQQRDVQRTDNLLLLQAGILVGGLLMFGLLGVFVQARIISPLANTIGNLDRSEEQHRNLYDAAPVGLWQADLSSGRYLKVNAAMARLSQASSESALIEKGDLFALFPLGKADLFKSTLLREGEVTDFEGSAPGHGGEGERALLVSARFYRDKGFAEGAVIDISDRKRAQSELEETHKLLVQTAHQAGMANIATSVLHNVGNVLNSLNVSCAVAEERLSRSRVSGLANAAGMFRKILEERPQKDEKSEKLADYLEILAGFFVTERDELAKEIKSMDQNIEHIRTIVTLQQSYAKGRVLVESVPPAELFEEALHVNTIALARHNVRVIREFQEVGPIGLEKHKVLQVLINLISNAKYAMDHLPAEERRLTLGLHVPQPGWISFEVRDNGIGFSSETKENLFRYGYTTRPEGHGFGLHSSALAATEMEGTLTGESDGPGKGAVFELKLPDQLGDS